MFCTLYNKEVFFECGGFDKDFLRRRSEDKLLNDIAISKGSYPILAMDVFVHHHGNLTTDGPGLNFSSDFKENHTIYKEKIDIFYKEKFEEDRLYTNLHKGMSFLFIRNGGIGDIIMSMFTLQGLKNKFPNVRIGYMTLPIYMDFVKSFNCIDEVLPMKLDCEFPYSERDKIRNIEDMSILKERYDYVKNYKVMTQL